MTEPDFHLDVEEWPGMLCFTVTGRQSPEADAAVDAAVRERCERLGVRLALVDIRGPDGRLTVLDNHRAATEFRERLGPTVRAVAVVELPEHREGSEMFELTATNRGTAVRFSESIDDARRWLSVIRPPPDGGSPP